MTDPGSHSLWLAQLKAGEPAAVQALLNHYFTRLVEFAHRQLRGRRLGIADSEDLALSAFASFQRGVEKGRFPRLEDRDDLCQVLRMLLRQKAINLLKYEYAKRRDRSRTQPLSAPRDGDSNSEEAGGVNLIGAEPAPEVAVELADEFRRHLDLLGDDVLREIAVCRMKDCSNEEIAGQLGCSVATVERRVRLIRQIWSEEAP
jgi:RNA polymerase sigma factor (sigma-70 family)